MTYPLSHSLIDTPHAINILHHQPHQYAAIIAITGTITIITAIITITDTTAIAITAPTAVIVVISVTS